MAHELSDGSKNTIKQFNLHKTINIEIYKEDPKVAIGNSSGIMLVAPFAFIPLIYISLYCILDWVVGLQTAVYLVDPHCLHERKATSKPAVGLPKK